MKIIFTFLLLTAFCCQLKSYDNLVVDSLKNELNNKAIDDYQRISIYANLVENLKYDDPLFSIDCAKRSISIGKELSEYYFLPMNYNNLSLIYRKLNKIDSMKLVIDSALKYSMITDNNKQIFNAYLHTGIYFEVRLMYDSAFAKYNIALELAKSNNENTNIASVLHNMGNVYYRQKDFEKALKYYLDALDIDEETNNKKGLCYSYINISNIYDLQKDYERSIEYALKALKLSKEQNFTLFIGESFDKLSVLNYEIGNYNQSIEYGLEALKYIDKTKDEFDRALVYNNLAGTFIKIDDFGMAEEYYTKSLNILQKLEHTYGSALMYGNFGDLYLLMAEDSILSKDIKIKEELYINKSTNLDLSIDNYFLSLEIGEKLPMDESKLRCYYGIARAYELSGDFENSVEYLKKGNKLKEDINKKNKDIEIKNLLSVKEKAIAEKNAKLLKENNSQLYTISIITTIGIILSILLILYSLSQKRRSEKLLLNILPKKFAEKLKSKQSILAEDIPEATIIFIDIVGFTEYAHTKSAKEVYQFLNKVFSEIDDLAEKHELEKIKTIGDGYMVAAGVPERVENSHLKGIEFSKQVMEIFSDRIVDDLDVQFRIGIAQGTVSSGVIGKTKFIYDVWGEAVNLASRLEASSDPNKIHIAEDLALKLEDKYELSKRKKIHLKGFGDYQTYFIDN